MENTTPSKLTGDFLRQQRKRADISIRTVARITGKDHAYISRIERGLISPSLDVLAEICSAIGIETWEAVACKTREQMLEEFRGQFSLNSTELSGLLAAAQGRELIQLLTQLAQIANEHGIEQLKSVLSAYELMRQAVEAQQKS